MFPSPQHLGLFGHGPCPVLVQSLEDHVILLHCLEAVGEENTDLTNDLLGRTFGISLFPRQELGPKVLFVSRVG